MGIWGAEGDPTVSVQSSDVLTFLSEPSLIF